MTISIALYQPDIAGNTGAVMRTAACLGLRIEIIEPTGFELSDRSLKRAGMDYLSLATLTKHVDFEAFETWRKAEARRLLLMTTKADAVVWDFDFKSGDILMFGRETAGVPDEVHAAADARLTIPMRAGARSMNLSASVALVAGEAVRQLRGR
ncbi:tRNA (cytidine(34)-2'-O)-methyltransferase [Fulvimarina sp. 2208YS6-2-32]|uniref:tRNA (cytidine(34)-2'-O)-methyltransferase n=1 Tax=Fulvimarina uroteuthidis TaxID=3098149 RepID=A0ABU5I566_9HYPH|nr:tRNA (cytidine(34)-2'-O)-methyltransferase [Fulvimarina sp. 2208YS6-2-32]MDY8110519.1 tRNA (cytidine(34)-2'-O)-methyltransferase [Fulvimarina sp. 2208YS6-2-32]